jgi:hypothetical protein
VSEKPKVLRIDSETALKVLNDIGAPMPRKVADYWWVDAGEWHAYLDSQFDTGGKP